MLWAFIISRLNFDRIFKCKSVCVILLMGEEEKSRAKKQKMTMDDEISKSFVTALQELKNLRPQLYSAAEYTEKSYLHSEQKQMVLDNLKDYAVRALVNAIDHVGTVAYKLNDIVEQQTLDISSIDLKVARLNQQLLTCQTYTDKEGIRQQQLLAIIPRHHKHYMLPNSGNKRVYINPDLPTDPTQTKQRRLYPSGTLAAKTLSWHLASETKSTLKGSRRSNISNDLKTKGNTSDAFNLLEGEKKHRMKSALASSAVAQTLGVIRRDSLEGSKRFTDQYKSVDNPTEMESVRAPVRSKSVISNFFAKQNIVHRN